MKRKSIVYDIESKLVFDVLGHPNYGVVKGGDIVNKKTKRVITKTVLGYTKGVWFGKKFITEHKLKPLLKKIERVYFPF